MFIPYRVVAAKMINVKCCLGATFVALFAIIFVFMLDSMAISEEHGETQQQQQQQEAEREDKGGKERGTRNHKDDECSSKSYDHRDGERESCARIRLRDLNVNRFKTEYLDRSEPFVIVDFLNA